MRITTSDLASIAAAIAAFEPDAMVSISSPGHPIATRRDRPHQALSFHDIEHAVAGRRVGPSHADVGALLAFLSRHRPDRLLVHCHAGLSRSPAIALAAMVAGGVDAATAVRDLARAVPEASPNRRIVALADARLVLAGELVAAVDRAFVQRRDQRGAMGEPTGMRVWHPS